MLRVNSKEVTSGDTFLALTGPNTDGHDFIEDAIDRGAACIIAERGEYSVKTIIVNDTRTYLSNYLKEMYMEKLTKIKIIGISGTTGKTTTGDIMYQTLNNLNIKTAFLGTNGFYINNEKIDTDASTPDIYEMYDFINKAIDSECENIIIEVSSNAVNQRHIEGLRFDIAVFTNINDIQDEEYLNSKIEIFKMLKKDGIAIINKKDPNYKYFTFQQNNNIFYGTEDSDCKISNIGLTYDFTEFNLNDKYVRIPLIGSQNIYNFLPSYIIAKEFELSDEEIIESLDKLKQVDGRYQKIKNGDSLVIIDYAYDVKDVERIINLTKEFKKGKIITLIGCGGERREDQRPQIGQLVARQSDYVVFTSDNPRHEDANKILEEITKGTRKTNYEVIENRKEAIKTAISKLTEKDILLILGKGNEEYQEIDGDKFPFKDENEVLKYVKN